MINTILLIIILVVVCLSYNHQLRKDKLKKNKNQKEINNKYQKAYNKYIPYHTNGSFNSDEDKKVELLRILNINKNYDLIDELMGGIWYSTLLKEVDNILKKDI
jgi:ABC-type lipopolysaccharide export system ATPase subunit